jgi:hypothetical protein
MKSLVIRKCIPEVLGVSNEPNLRPYQRFQKQVIFETRSVVDDHDFQRSWLAVNHKRVSPETFEKGLYKSGRVVVDDDNGEIRRFAHRTLGGVLKSAWIIA